LLQKEGAQVSYNDPFFEYVGHGRKYKLEMANTPLENLQQFDAVGIATDHSSYNYPRIVGRSQLVIDTRMRRAGLRARKSCVAKP